ncbi:MAG: 30S ribosomal protein S12 methylthiotransferase RimO [Planctomycetes bacterium]|nr:30S ribosomal protein S12 methylthiotransferase RimO [Planctomycetota bacterium]MCW8134590.1 30S ribosomal protein S12 methylthiotransferase RimO [Planctomycetota bacterium]
MKTALGTVAFISLGCPKNLIDSESMLGQIAAQGFVVTPDYEHADVVVINTCGFLDASRMESLEHINRMVELKQRGDVKRVVVAGCMVGNYRPMLDQQAPGADALVSVNDRMRLADVLKELSSSGELARRVAISDPDARGTVYDDRARLRMTPRHYAYLRISEGCDHKCAFCTIPSIRGRFRSKPRAQIIEEAAELAQDGARELIIVAQDSTYYGLDSEGRKSLHELLAELAKVKGIDWIRLMYAYPTQVTDELIELLADEPKLLGYIDMPLQHISSPVLARMRRGSTRDTSLRLIEKLRTRVPGLTLRSTFIVGFPGETDEQFDELLDFIRQGHIDRAGAFPFSDEDKAASFVLDGKLPQDVIAARHAAFMEVAREDLFKRNAALVGKTIDVLTEGESQDPKYPTEARSRADAPEIDCTVRLKQRVAPGEILQVRVSRSLGYDLLADRA